MNKLFNLKEWVSIPDAARHLSMVLGEETNEADILRLALDGHLKLSINFINHAKARLGKIVSWNDTEWGIYRKLDMPPMSEPSTSSKKVLDCPPKFLSVWNEIPEDEKDDFSFMLKSLKIDSERFINLDDKVATIDGIWDLPMIGNERLDIEHKYQQFTGGPEVTLQGLDGAFVENEDGVICQLQDSFDDNIYQPGSQAKLRALEEHIALNQIKEAESQKLINDHEQERKKFLGQRAARNNLSNYYPAGGLPEDGILVVRTAALKKFEQSINNTSKPISTTERNTLLTVIAALCDYSAINFQERGAAVQIAKLSEEIGSPVTDDTIRAILAKIPNALESRKK